MCRSGISPNPTSSCVLYYNATHMITLLDLPRSLREACGLELIAAVAPTDPYPVAEPKGAKRFKLLQSIPPDEKKYHERVRQLLEDALKEARRYLGDRPWCYDRHVTCDDETGQVPQGQKKGERYPDVTCQPRAYPSSSNREALVKTDQVGAEDCATKDLREIFIDLTASSATTAGDLTMPPVILSPLANHVCFNSNLHNACIHNPNTDAVRLHVEGRIYHIPACSTFILSTVVSGMRAFNSALRTLPRNISNGPGKFKFDLILLDPPWPNRSVRHSLQYNTIKNPLLQTIPIISSTLSCAGHVAIWITNKRSVRLLALQALFRIGLTLIAEIIWLKITTRGEPVTPLDGLWRKPWEVCLLLHRHEVTMRSESFFGDVEEQELYPPVPQHIVLSVPTTHSQKPHLSPLLTPFLQPPYTALELFARNLTSGWWSWGDQVLQFMEQQQTY